MLMSKFINLITAMTTHLEKDKIKPQRILTM